MNPLNLIPRHDWKPRDLLPQFPRRATTLLPSVWVEELMAKRFGALIICGPCSWKYADGIKRWCYVRHPDMKVQGNACDFCTKVPPGQTPLWFKEERQYPTQQDYAREQAHARSPWPRNFQGEIRVRRAS